MRSLRTTTRRSARLFASLRLPTRQQQRSALPIIFKPSLISCYRRPCVIASSGRRSLRQESRSISGSRCRLVPSSSHSDVSRLRLTSNRRRILYAACQSDGAGRRRRPRSSYGRTTATVRAAGRRAYGQVLLRRWLLWLVMMRWRPSKRVWGCSLSDGSQIQRSSRTSLSSFNLVR